MKQYTSVPAEPGGEVEYQFGLDGVVFTARIRPDDADFAMEFSEIAGLSLAGADLMSAEGVAFTARFFRLLLGASEYARLRQHLQAHRPKSELLGEIIRDLSVWAEERQEEVADRPTMPSARSSRGLRPAKGDRASQLAALAGGDADIIVIDPAQVMPPDQPRTGRRQAKGSRRKAG